MFITLKLANDGSSITVNVDQISTMTDVPSGTQVSLSNGHFFQVEESRALILGEIRGRLRSATAKPLQLTAAGVADLILGKHEIKASWIRSGAQIRELLIEAVDEARK